MHLNSIKTLYTTRLWYVNVFLVYCFSLYIFLNRVYLLANFTLVIFTAKFYYLQIERPPLAL